MKWTKGEIKKLEEIYFNASINELIKQIPNKTIQAIRRKANRLGLKASKEKRYNYRQSSWSKNEITKRARAPTRSPGRPHKHDI